MNASNTNIRRFVAENSRAALRQVRESLGGDAIILSNRSVDGGVEILAAASEAVEALTRPVVAAAAAAPVPQAPAMATPTDLGIKAPEEAKTVGKKGLASLFARRAQSTADVAPVTVDAAPNAAPVAAAKAANSYLSFADELVAATLDDEAADDFVSYIAPQAARPVEVAAPVQRQAEPVPPQRVVEAAPAEPAMSAAALNEVVAREVKNEFSREFGRDVINDMTLDVSREVSQAVTDEVTREVSSSVARDVTRDVTEQVTRELRAMQATLSEQLATLTWTDSMRRQPGKTKLMQDLILAGFSPALSRHIQSRLPDDFGADEANDWAKNILRRNLPIATEAESLIDEGGVYALVGPTGVGKTTTVAKLAARFAMKHGVDQLALITTDGFRIGAQDQLRIYGKILGIGVHSIHDEASLKSAMDQLKNKKLVLIDTAGMSQRDERVAEQIAMLRGVKAKRLVVLNATSDAETLDHVVARFADRDFAGCVITKTDEAARLGPVLDAVIRHRLRIHHVSNGQKVPEDLERPDAAALVETALQRPAPSAAFSLHTEDEPTWMAAVSGRAEMLDPSLLAMPVAARATEGLHA